VEWMWPYSLLISSLTSFMLIFWQLSHWVIFGILLDTDTRYWRNPYYVCFSPFFLEVRRLGGIETEFKGTSILLGRNNIYVNDSAASLHLTKQQNYVSIWDPTANNKPVEGFGFILELHFCQSSGHKIDL
jgi:hypothetical protein